MIALVFRRLRAGLPALLVAAAALVVAAVAALALAGRSEAAAACVCTEESLEDRFDAADAAVVARFVQERDKTAGRRVLVFEVEQRVKGDASGTLVVTSPSGTDCDLDVDERRTSVGLLLTRASDETWLATACSLVDPGRLVAAGGEPRGGEIKVVIGIVVLALVLALAFVRLRRGSRPQLPGAREP
jgi:hypothetical protein